MPADTINTNQHYVSQMLLRGFATAADSEQVHLFDKKTGKQFTTAIRIVAAERGYYDLSDSATLDAAMNRADGTASGIINKIRDRQSLSGTPREDREMLAGFVALQILRTRGFQEGYRHIGQTMVDAIKERGLIPPPEWEEELRAEKVREEYLRVIPSFMRDFMPHLLDKDLLLYKTDSSLPFCISDNPVALNNTVNDGDGIRGTLGLAVRGIEIFLPISKTLTLAYICPSVGMAFELAKRNLRQLGGFISEDGFYYLQARDTGKALVLKPDNVRFQNSLQIWNAERFVVASRDDFADATDIVEHDPRARVGRRITAT
jgi:hypothetical protein